jgi:alpha-L-fucosidase
MSAVQVVQRLCDVVSKNGNLLLSIPMKGDGTIDSEERKIVEGIGAWLARFGDAIFDTRPWRIFGEGPTAVASGQFGEATAKPFTAQDVRFTTKKDDLFAITLGPLASDTLTVGSLADGPAGTIERVELVGVADPLAFTRDATGLHVNLPQHARDDYGLALRIKGRGIVNS